MLLSSLFGKACEVKGPILCCSFVLILYFLKLFSFSTWKYSSVVTFLYHYPIPFPEFNVSENPDFL